MAEPRRSPFIWVTWLAKVMAGDCACQWQTWFQTHHKLTQKQPPTYDQVGWKIEHTRALTELAQILKEKGFVPQLEYEVKLDLSVPGAVLKGAADCLVEQKSQVVVYDCKVGQPRAADQIQLMIYLLCLAQAPQFAGRKLLGAVLYRDARCDVPVLPDTFAANFDFFVDLLCSPSSPIKTPGEDCRYCPVTRADCVERVEG